MYRLIFLNGKDKGKRLAIRDALISVGRDPECFLRIDDDEVSRRHAILEQRGDGVYLKDLDATNPTLVNGAPVKEVQLRHGDRIEFGNTLLQFQTLAESTGSERRGVSYTEEIATAAVVLILVAEVVLLGYLVVRHRQVVAAAPEEVLSESPAASVAPVSVDAKPAANVISPTEPAITEPATGSVMPSAVIAAPPTAAVETVAASELETLRAEIEDLKRQMKGLAATTLTEMASASASTSAPDPTAVTAEQDAILVRAQALLRQATAEIARMNYVQADELLQRTQIMAPDFLPAYIERAKLFEQRGMVKAAGEQWAEVLHRSMGTPLYEQAAAERIRLARLLAAQPVSAPAPDSRDAAGDRLPRRVRILDVQQERFPKNEQFDEMRLVRVVLKLRPGEKDLDPYNVKVLVTFFDENTETQQIKPTRAVVSKALSVESPWRDGQQKSVSATYIVPQGFREQEFAEYGERMLYYGYVVQVYYREKLQDIEARPRSLTNLLSQIPAPVHKP